MPFAIEIVDCRLLSVSFTFSSAEHENRVHKCYRWKVPHELNFRLLKVLAKKTDPNFSIVVNFNFPLGASQHLSPAVIVVLTRENNYRIAKFCQSAQVMIFTRWASFSKSVWIRVFDSYIKNCFLAKHSLFCAIPNVTFLLIGEASTKYCKTVIDITNTTTFDEPF